MINKKNSHLVFGLVLLAIMPQCAKYEGNRLQAPQAPIHKKENIEIAKKPLTEKECQYYFGGRKLIKRGYQPVQIYIKNNSKRTLYLSPNHITLPMEPVTSVARRMKRNLGWKVTKYFIIGGPIWATIEGISSHDANKTIVKDMNEKSIRLDKAIKIRPYGIMNRVLFVAKENYNSNFKLSLFEAETNKKISFYL